MKRVGLGFIVWKNSNFSRILHTFGAQKMGNV
jgi:hypothetical protein